MIVIKPVVSARDKRVFINLPWQLYRGDKNWVPPLKMDMRSTLDPKKNALLRLGPHQYFLAYRDGKPVGRIGVGIDRHLNEVKGFKAGYLTLFESVEDYEVSKALFDAGCVWLKAHGAEFVTGPQSPSNGDDYRGLLLQGYDSPPVLYDSYNPPYYVDYFERYGFRKDFDRNAYFIRVGDIPADMARGVEYAKRRYKFHTRRLNLKRIHPELAGMKAVLDAGWPDNWQDMVPPTMEEMVDEYKKLVPFADKDLLWVAETDEDPRIIGFFIALPDYNQCFAKMNGRLFPFGAVKFLWLKRRINQGRVFVMFVHPDFWNKGVAAALYLSAIEAAKAKGYTQGEGSTIHEFNNKMNRDAQSVGARLYKIYRVYRKELA
ncbi:MAG: GNAT family N-acetyltransferase [Patescibacteria group bacterium]